MHHHHRSPTARKGRRGISTPALLMVVMSALLFIVMAIDLAQISLQRREMQTGADSASVSAVGRLMDRRWLYLGREGTSPDQQMWNDLPQMQADEAFDQAQFIAAGNDVAGQPITLSEDAVIFGQVDDCTSGDPAIQMVSQTEPANSIGVELIRSELGGNPPILWLAKQTGLDQVDITVRSQACVDTRIHGFKPLQFANVPLAPLALFDRPGGTPVSVPGAGPDDELPAELWWGKGPQDEFAAGPLGNDVGPSGDGIAEMVFRLRTADSEQPTDDSRPCALMGFHASHLTPTEFMRLARDGIGANDLLAYGGSITLSDEDFPALCPAEFSLEDSELDSICEEIRRHLIGEPRIWPVVADCSSVMNGDPTVGIIGFVAGCVVDCDVDSNDGSLIVVIQPCLVQTPTALTGRLAQLNPWIGKLLLVR